MPSAPHIVVIGAGAFGGWAALSLLRQQSCMGPVTLIDAWGPGNSLSSSGGETRIIRTTYGSRSVYTQMALEAMDRWREYDTRWKAGLMHRTGVLWMNGGMEEFARASHAALRDAGIPVEWWDRKELQHRFPQIGIDGVSSALFEPDAGFLYARRACAHVVDRFVAEGGSYQSGTVAAPVTMTGAGLRTIAMQDGSTISADVFVFACGPWMGSLFPDVLGSRITSTRQEVSYFETPADVSSFDTSSLPVWLEMGDHVMYGIPANTRHAFKIGDDTPGEPFDPTTGDRSPTPGVIAAMRDYMRRRFPAMADAPYAGTEVCQYEATTDSDFIMDRHPDAPNVWLVGGGSGHGFKFGPVIGPMVATAVFADSSVEPMFGLARFSAGAEAPEKWA
jgi:glycine/D-amino acid oxidase-like deaminating enzyme